MRLRLQLLLAAILAVCTLSIGGLAEAEDGATDRAKIEIVYVAAPDQSDRHLRVRLLLPDGDEPFPLAVINHGSPLTRQDRLEMRDPKFTQLSDWFLDRGYAVALPLRRGYGANGGKWNEAYGACDDPHYFEAGLESAKDIGAVIGDLQDREDIADTGTVVVGNSAGGWGTLALASLNPKGVRAYINFSGGRGGHVDDKPDLNCDGDRLVEAAGRYGETTRGQSLWLYAENDPFFPPELVERMYSAFVESGGKARLEMLTPFENNGHRLSADGEDIWAPILGEFLGRKTGR